MSTPAETLRDLLYPGVVHMCHDIPEISYSLYTTHGRIVLDVTGPARPDGVACDILSAEEIGDGSYRELFKPRVEEALRKVGAT